MSSSYINAKGTIAKSFKFGPNGIALSTNAIIDKNGNVVKSLVRSDVLENGKKLRVVFEREDQPLSATLDSFISSSEIRSIQTLGTGGLRIYLKNYIENNTPEYFDLLPSSGGGGSGNGNVVGPLSATDNNIAVFDGSSGALIKDSNYSISTAENLVEHMEYNPYTDSTEIKASADNTIPTTNAVLEYIGVLDEAIQKRLSGSL